MTNPGVTDLVAYWRVEEESGVRYDSHGSYDLTAYNNPGYGDGRRGKAVNLVSTNDEILYINDTPELSMGGDVSFCIGFWFKSHKITSNFRLISKWNAGGNYEYLVEVNNSRVGFWVRNAADTGSNYAIANAFGDLNNDTWYFVCAYFNENINMLGISVNDVWNTASGPSDGVRDSFNPLIFGRDSSGDYNHDGLIDEVFIYRERVLETSEYTWLYNFGYGRTYSELTAPASSPPPAGELAIHVLEASGTLLSVIDIIEDYYSLTWAERYSEVGDFELELPIEYALSSSVVFGNFLYISVSDKLMLIEDIKPFFSEEKTSLLIKGQSSECLLKRRVLLDPINVDGVAESIIHTLMADNITDPVDTNREIGLFKNRDSLSALTSETIEDQFEMQDVYTVVETICKNTVLGFKIINIDSQLAFFIYKGEDRSYDQSDNSYVIFSDDFDNVIESSFYESEKDKINIVLIATNDEAEPLQRVFIWKDGESEPQWLGRREVVLETEIERNLGEGPPSGTVSSEYKHPTLGISGRVCLDAVGISATPTFEVSTYIPPLSDAEVLSIITTRGRQLLEEEKLVGLFEGDFNIQGNFKYGVDFFMGDIVQCNIEGKNVKARIIELVRSYSTEGEKSYVAMDFII